MEYPKPIMKITELEKLGYSREFLLNAFYDKNQTFAWKINPTAKNSLILFETAGLEEYRLKTIALQKQMRQRLARVM
ncbi:MAG: hypothetical protein E7299_08045 [Lachnospiraceae bacterium]|nr:hypothetical protein [Lachnospiraceae bacterium]